MLTEIRSTQYHYFCDSQRRIQGEYKFWWDNGELWEHCFYVDGKRHGEYKRWNRNNGELQCHGLYVNDQLVSFNEIPYPKTPEDRVYFKLKYDLMLIE